MTRAIEVLCIAVPCLLVGYYAGRQDGFWRGWAAGYDTAREGKFGGILLRARLPRG